MPHKKNYHSTKLEFLALKWTVTEHFKEYLPYQSFLVRMDNNPMTYIMMTPNLDTTGHQWVSALVQFNFKLEYQKGCDNTVADALSQGITWSDLNTMKSILDSYIGNCTSGQSSQPCHSWGWPSLGTKGMCHGRPCFCTNACDLLGWSQERRPNIDCSVGLAEGTGEIWKHFWQNTPPAKKANWSYRIGRTLQFIRGPYTCDQCLEVRPKISYSLWYIGPIVLPPWMGAAGMQVIRDVTWPYCCYRNTSGGQVWPNSCNRPVSLAHVACNKRAMYLKYLYTQLWLVPWWTSCM